MANFILQSWHLLLAILAGAVHEEQQQVIEYLRTETQVLKEKPAIPPAVKRGESYDNGISRDADGSHGHFDVCPRV